MPFDGILVIDKPAHITSRDAVNRVQTWFPRGTRVGHTGTLDPLATGVLVLCLGVATRLTEYVQHMKKAYRAGILLGATSDTDDADGAVTPNPDAPMPTREQVQQVLAEFVGTIEQVPPAYSAAKVTGRRAYDLARKGHDVKLAPRPVTIHAIDIIAYEYPYLEIDVHCGKGTYIRSLARDLGVRLGCGGYIAALRRMHVGCFRVEDGASLNLSAEEARQRLLPIAHAVSDLPTIALPVSDVARMLHGQVVPLPTDFTAEATEAAVLDSAGRLIAVVEINRDLGMVRPAKAFVRGDAQSDRSDPAR